MINKYFFLVGQGGRSEYRVRAVDIIPLIPELIYKGLLRDIESNNRWAHYMSGGRYYIRVYLDSCLLHDWLKKKRIKVMSYEEINDHSITFENEPDYNSVDNCMDNPNTTIYI